MAELEQNGDNQLGIIGVSNKFANLNRLIIRDLNNNLTKPTFSKYSKDEISTYIADPYRYEKQLREAVVYLYGASSHFRRLINYFANLSDLCYVVSPYKIDPLSVNPKSINRNYRKVLNVMNAFNVRTQFPKILTVCLREDVFYGTMWITSDDITIQQLPSEYCAISEVEGNVPNVSFNFSYFDSKQALLPYYPPEFQSKYNVYSSNRTQNWIKLDSPTSFAVKCNRDILEYAMPPFAGVLREVYDLEDYKSLKLSRTEIENYAMVSMKIPTDNEGNYLIDYKKAKEFWSNLDGVLPDEIGSVLTPMDITKISFDRSNAGDTDTISDAEQHLFTAAGVSSLLFNNEKASANALALSIKADQAITFGIVKCIEDVVNRYIHSLSFGKYFKVTFLNVSEYNRKEAGDQYLKAAQYGMPTISMYISSQGLNQSELDTMNFLENEVLCLKDKLVPLRSSSTMSSDASTDSSAPTDEGGRPQLDETELTDSGEQSRIDGDDW